MNYQEILNKVRLFEYDVNNEVFSNSIGIKEEVNISKFYQQYNSLFRKENIDFVKSLVKPSHGGEKRKYMYLHSFLVGTYIDKEISAIKDEMLTFSAKAVINLDGNKTPYRQLHNLIINESANDKRKKLYELGRPIRRVLSEYTEKIREKRESALKKLGYNNYLEVYSELKDINYIEEQEKFKEILSKTDSFYYELIRKRLASIWLPMWKAKPYDYAYSVRIKKFDKYFPNEEMVNILIRVLNGLNINITEQKNIELELEDREKKINRAFCLGLRIPQNVKLVLKPQGGYSDYETLLHETGHAEHFALTNSELAYEVRHLGDYTLTESYAALFANLMQNKDWLQTYISMPENEIDEFRRLMLEIDLYFTRRYIAKSFYEIKLHSNDLRRLDENFNPTELQYSNFKECYVDILTRITGLQHDQDNYLLDVDDGLYVMEYLRSWLFEAMLRNFLINKYGEKWFLSKEASKLLKSFFARGNAPKIEELAKELGFDKIIATDLVNNYLLFLH